MIKKFGNEYLFFKWKIIMESNSFIPIVIIRNISLYAGSRTGSRVTFCHLRSLSAEYPVHGTVIIIPLSTSKKLPKRRSPPYVPRLSLLLLGAVKLAQKDALRQLRL